MVNTRKADLKRKVRARGLKNWKKTGKDLWKKKRRYGEETIKIIKTPQSKIYEYIRKFDGISQEYKLFKTKLQALTFAKAYMKKH